MEIDKKTISKVDKLRELILKKQGNNMLTKEIKKEFISTELLRLDWALGGGFLRGRYYHLLGVESSGKSAIATHFAGVVQKNGGTVLYCDAEHTFDGDYALKTFGFDYKADSVLFSQNNNAIKVMESIEDAIDAGIDLIIIDSVDFLQGQAAESGSLGDANVGGIAKISKDFFRRITQKLYDQKCILIAIAHEVPKINMGGYVNPNAPKTDTNNGVIWKFAASARIKITRIEGIKVGDNIIGQVSKVRMLKNKIDCPFRDVNLALRYNVGYDSGSEIFDIAVDMGLIIKPEKGYKYSFDTDIFPELADQTFLGKEKTITFLNSEEAAVLKENITERIKIMMQGGEI